MKKLTCHCGGVEAEVKVPESGFEKLMRCNCSLCKRKGYIIGIIGPEDLRIINELPRNPVGKVLRRNLKELFN